MVIPDLLPCGYLVGDNTNIAVMLNGMLWPFFRLTHGLRKWSKWKWLRCDVKCKIIIACFNVSKLIILNGKKWLLIVFSLYTVFKMFFNRIAYFSWFTLDACVCFVYKRQPPGTREGQVRGSADPLKFGDEVRNCIRRYWKSTYHVTW